MPFQSPLPEGRAGAGVSARLAGSALINPRVFGLFMFGQMSMNVTQGTPTQRIARDAEDYPSPLRTRLGANAPEVLVVLGDRRLLRSRRTALFCSARTPGDAILRAHDVARRMRDEGVTVISGFHSPIEKECLRIPAETREAFDAGRVLFLSPFAGHPTRITKESAVRRNEVVAALADNVYIAHIEPDSSTAHAAQSIAAWGIPRVQETTTG